MRLAIPTLRVAPALVLAALSSCGSSPPSRFYGLTPVAASGDPPSEVCVLLAVVELPPYLDGPGIVTRDGPNRIRRADFDRWAEPLGEAVTRVLAWDLARLLPSERVFRSPWERPAPVDFAVTVVVQRFDVEEGRAVLEAAWKLASGAGGDALVVRGSRLERPVDASDYGAIPGAMSELLGDLAGEIAAEVRTRAEGGGAGGP